MNKYLTFLGYSSETEIKIVISDERVGVCLESDDKWAQFCFGKPEYPEAQMHQMWLKMAGEVNGATKLPRGEHARLWSISGLGVHIPAINMVLRRAGLTKGLPKILHPCVTPTLGTGTATY